MSQNNQQSTENSDVAKSAGLAFLGRLGALVEIISLPLFTWLYGAATLGIFFTLWSLVKILTTFTECAMTTSLQRFSPKAKNNSEKRAVIKTAILTGLFLSSILSLFIFWVAPTLSQYFNAKPEDALKLTSIIQTYIWVLPFWTLVEIVTATVRAERKFGPEIRIRIFYEQGLRIFAGVGFFYLGYHSFGLFFAHISSVIIALALSFQLLSKFHNLKEILKEKLNPKQTKEILSFSIFMMPANMIKRANSELPILFLNILLPGTQGAEAAAIYGVGRKITSVLQVVRQSFEYVVAPFATHKLTHETHDDLEEMYGFATRVIIAIALPFAALLVAIRGDIISIFTPEFISASGVIFILAMGRIGEALTGPSSSIIEMTGHKLLPFLNGIAGLSVLVGIQLYFGKDLNTSGAALAAASGLMTTAILSLIENMAFYKLNPYRPNGFFKVFFFSTLFSFGLNYSVQFTSSFGHLVSFSTGIVAFLLSLMLIIRFGFSERDAKALGKLGIWFGKRHINE